ncbi:hypothetical protein RW092_01720 [Paenibacillus sp. 3LSP]|nr:MULTISPECIES: hypothetical protein [Bacilli]MDU0318985.1 hypothetical protein [Enterococcus sp. 2STP]MDU0328921.1 hypothetical protein [Paenibacillus sp. 3LSP]MDU0334503.1 hypothetical protein [Enterococcus sp. 2CBP]MDU0350244.1 hypothetical protein [Enterococcus sp. 3MOLP]
MKKIENWFDIISDLLGCTFVLALILMLVGALMKLAVIIWQSIF